MRRTLTIDIETLPAVEMAGNGLLALQAETTTEDHLKTALNRDFGRILCIGYIDEDPRGRIESGVLGWDEQRETFIDDERNTLTRFWELMCGFSHDRDRIVGHNIFDFDLKFILKRSVVHGVRPGVELSFARYRNRPIYDTMMEWERWSFNSKISLDKLARVLNLPSSKEQGVEGSQVYELYLAGDYRAIHDYCLRDVALTRRIYKRMNFESCAFANLATAQVEGAKLMA
jgi:DNA polymerase elongation subunit (family B)